jgi:hypothetical protein
MTLTLPIEWPTWVILGALALAGLAMYVWRG